MRIIGGAINKNDREDAKKCPVIMRVTRHEFGRIEARPGRGNNSRLSAAEARRISGELASAT